MPSGSAEAVVNSVQVQMTEEYLEMEIESLLTFCCSRKQLIRQSAMLSCCLRMQ